jgi:hypothetical protein
LKECLQARVGFAFLDKRKNHISKIALSRFAVGTRIEELSNNTEESIKTKAVNFQWFSIPMDESTDVNDTKLLDISFRGIDKELSINEELGALTPVKGVYTG